MFTAGKSKNVNNIFLVRHLIKDNSCLVSWDLTIYLNKKKAKIQLNQRQFMHGELRLHMYLQLVFIKAPLKEIINTHPVKEKYLSKSYLNFIF